MNDFPHGSYGMVAESPYVPPQYGHRASRDETLIVGDVHASFDGTGPIIVFSSKDTTTVAVATRAPTNHRRKSRR